MADRISDESLKAHLASATCGPWKAVSQEHWDSGLTYTSVQPQKADPEAMRHLLMANGEHHVCRMSHTAARHRIAKYLADARLIALSPALAAEVLRLREALSDMMALFSADGLLRRGAEVQAALALSRYALSTPPAHVVDAVKGEADNG